MNSFFPRLVSWNVTSKCNLHCAHCYLDAGNSTAKVGELSTLESLDVIDQLADFSPGAMIVFTGGEPLLRPDLFQLIAYAAELGLLPVLGTNGLLLSPDRVAGLIESNLAGVGISLDSLDPDRHDDFRGLPGAWNQTIEGIENAMTAGLAVQIHTTVTSGNYLEIDNLMDFAAEKGAVAFHLFFLVCTGRGQQISDITPAQYEQALRSLVAAQEKYQGQMLVRARCAPHFRRLAYVQNEMLARSSVGCMAGRSYLRITPQGRITPCPYLPDVAGDLRRNSLRQIWESALVFQLLRQPDLRGRCGACEFSELCGGCRARAFATNGDIMAEDPWCDFQPGTSRKFPKKLVTIDEFQPQWTNEARERLSRVPVALRSMVEQSVEAYAQSIEESTITVEILAAVRKKGMNRMTKSRIANRKRV